MQWRSTMNRLVVTLVTLALLLFVPAGRITWTRGWIFLLVFSLLMAAEHRLLHTREAGDVQN